MLDDKTPLQMKPCKHTKGGECLNTAYCNAYGCPDKSGFNCEHLNKKVKVISKYFNCEKTVEMCIDCNKYLTQPKTEC